MDVAVVGVDDQFPIGPLRIFMSADEEFEGEPFEDVIVSGLEFVSRKRADNGAGFGDVLDEKFVGEFVEQRGHVGSFGGVKVFNILGTQKKSFYRNHAKHGRCGSNVNYPTRLESVFHRVMMDSIPTGRMEPTGTCEA